MKARHRKIFVYFAAATIGLWLAGVASGYGRTRREDRGWSSSGGDF